MHGFSEVLLEPLEAFLKPPDLLVQGDHLAGGFVQNSLLAYGQCGQFVLHRW